MLKKNITILVLLSAAFCLFIPSANAGLWTDPNGFDVNVVEGYHTTDILTVGNNGAGNLNFQVRTRVIGGSGGAAGIANLSAVTEGLVSSGNQSQNFPLPNNVQYKPDEVIVRFAPKPEGIQFNSAEKLNVMSTLSGATIKKEFGLVPGLSVVKLPKGMTVETAIQNLSKTSGVLYAHANYQVQALSTFPNDPRFSELWGMHNTGQSGGTVDADIDAPEAWDIGTGSRDVVVAVIDTGVDYTHPDLAANMWVNQAELNGLPGVDDDHNGYVDDIYGYDFVNNDGDPWDDHFHGTHCAGTIGGVGNNGVGVAGVCWKVKIMALKFLDSSGSGWTDNAIRAVEYSRQMGAKLSSNSWGGGGYSQALKDAIDAAGAAGMLFVAAAGNSDSDNDTSPHYPSSYTSPSLIAVMATDNYDNKSSFSCYGLTSVDIGAPGSNILSCQPGGGYQYLSGTSMATPHVSGACALLWSMNPSLSNSEVKDILLRTVDPTLAGKCVSGGRLNLYKAICETTVPWITIDPNHGTIGPGQSTELNVIFDTVDLIPGTYRAEIMVVSNDPCSPAIVPVTMIVNPDALQISPAGNFESSGTQGGPFLPGFKTYTLTNNGSLPVNWTTFPTAGWVTISPPAGMLGPGTSMDVNVYIGANANSLDPNVYSQDLVFQNLDSGSIKTRSAKLSVKPPDLFTKLSSSASDLVGLSITFRPNGSIGCYEACRDSLNVFPTDPNGSTYLPLGDDDFVEILFTDGKQFWFYDQSYDRFYIGSNGYITFGAGDSGFEGSLANHFSLPRISGFFTDLTPSNSQSISVKQLEDRIAVTYIDVPMYGDKTSKTSFQIELFFADGSIRVTWLALPAAAGVAGLSRGHGLPPEFEESHFREYPICWPLGDFDRNYVVDLADLTIFVKSWLNDDCNYPLWCDRTDLDFSSDVEGVDFSIFAKNWGVIKSTMPLPVSHWKFDEGSGTIARDSAGSNDGNIIGATWTSGQIGGGLKFDGVNDYVEVPYNDSIGPGYITMSTWVRPDVSRGMMLIAKSRYSDCSSEQYALSIGADGIPASSIKRNSSCAIGQGWKGVWSSSGVTVGQWYLITSTWDGSVFKIYINGELSGTNNSIPAGLIDYCPGGTLRFGIWWSVDQVPFQGVMDDVRIYNSALSAEEVKQLYHEGLTEKASNPNPADGQTAVDPNAKLNWLPGRDAVTHDVYFGTDFNEVNEADIYDTNVYMGNQDVNCWDVNNYDANGLEPGTTFYWRIDEVAAIATAKGDTWSFTTITTGIDPNIVAWWKFDEGTGTVAYDSIGHNDGTLHGNPQWVTGQVGGALDCNGNGAYVQIPDNDFLTPSKEITIVYWLYSRAGAGIYKYAACPDQIGHGSPGNSRAYAFDVGTNTHLLVHQTKDASDQIISIGTISLNEWHHVAATFNQGQASLYIDGELDSTKTLSVTSIMNDAQPLIIGGYWEYCTPSFIKSWNGSIDDLRIYNRALSATEIRALYQSGL